MANYFDDERFYATNTKHPRADRLSHWVACNSTRILIEKAIARLPNIELVQYINEWETINKDEASEAQFCLHTQLVKDPPLSCSPDAGFLLRYQNQAMVYYLEQDRATSSPRQVAARKHRGYSELLRQKGHEKHFPETTVPYFRILFVTTSETRAKKTQQEMKTRSGKEAWMMLNEKVLDENNFFTGSVALDHKGELGPLLNISKDKPNMATAVASTDH